MTNHDVQAKLFEKNCEIEWLQHIRAEKDALIVEKDRLLRLAESQGSSWRGIAWFALAACGVLAGLLVYSR